MRRYYSNGKLLLTGEYLVLDGAKALALPTVYGQDLQVEKLADNKIIWDSFDQNNQLWFSCKIDITNLKLLSSSNKEIAETLLHILKQAKEIKQLNFEVDFLKPNEGFYIKTNLSFPRNWGLGTSSTLINNIAQWAKINPYLLQFKTFGGSGYDIACANNNLPIKYQLLNKEPHVNIVNFNPNFSNQLYFIFLNKKQNSREGITRYHQFTGDTSAIANKISKISNAIIQSDNISEFEKLLEEHESIIAKVIQQKPIQELLFSDYFGQTKSLGAWGGDFILATGNENTPNYFKNKGFETIIPFKEIFLG